MSKPRVLDLYCGQGGASRGLARAGFEVTGVDNERKHGRHYPYRFVCGDAIEYLAEHGHEYVAVWASPPCFRYSAGTRAQDRSRYPDLIGPTREALQALDVPWVIENVPGAPLIDPIMLCGTEFGLTAIDDDGTPLEMWRHRFFESNLRLQRCGECQHFKYAQQIAGSYGGARRNKDEARHVRHGGYVPSKAVQERLLGITGMTQEALYLSIPPVFAEHIGLQFMEAINAMRTDTLEETA